MVREPPASQQSQARQKERRELLHVVRGGGYEGHKVMEVEERRGVGFV